MPIFHRDRDVAEKRMPAFGRSTSIPAVGRFSEPEPTSGATNCAQQSAARASARILDYAVFHRRLEADDRRARDCCRAAAGDQGSIDISPREVASRRGKSCDGIAAEVVQVTRRERIDIRCRAPVHMVGFVEQGVRHTGETFLEGLPLSTLRDLRRKVIFVPAGHVFHEWQQPTLLPRMIYLCFDPKRISLELEPLGREALRTPRLYFEDAALWETAHKLRRLIEAPELESPICLEALSVIVAHELARSALGPARPARVARGGLAAWQQRILTDYIEDNLAERISLDELAKLVRLSPYHLCRAFKQSFGMPPHRYHTSRRVERAKILLVRPGCSVTEIGLEVGFSETSSFSAAFRKATGQTPTAYHRCLR
jgi:AraC family transcriptional regulator